MAKINQELRNLEIFEIDLLDHLNTIRVIEKLFFGGGTMLRLCHNLNRYSTDLDFWLKPEINVDELFNNLLSSLSDKYEIIDSANKKFTLLFQLRSGVSKRSLKIEIRKNQKYFEWERKIAFSNYSTKQVQVLGLTLKQMMDNKIEALLSRKIIRDCFDINFLFKRGVPLPSDKETLNNILKIIDSFGDKDFKVTLGSLLDEKERELYNLTKFDTLRTEVVGMINTS